MPEIEGESQPLDSPSEDAVRRRAMEQLRQSIADGQHWYVALLRSIAIWPLGEETYNGRRYRYLVAGEALDWLLLAERLCEEAGALIPQPEKVELLFGKPPLKLSKEEFKSLIGSQKYRAHLNYFYGIIVEQALQVVVELEIGKRRHVNLMPSDVQADVFQQIYGSSELALLARFQEERGCGTSDSITFSDLVEFTYWLFKYRLQHCDPSRVASDTQKALKYLRELRDDSEFYV